MRQQGVGGCFASLPLTSCRRVVGAALDVSEKLKQIDAVLELGSESESGEQKRTNELREE